MNFTQLLMFVALMIAALVNSGCQATVANSDGDDRRPAATDSQSTASLPEPTPLASEPATPLFLRSDFSQGPQSWSAGYSGYHEDDAAAIEFEAGPRSLPPEISQSRHGFLISGANFSSVLFLWMKRSLGPDEGLRPDQNYRVRYRLRFASSGSAECLGPGGSPGDARILAGASTQEPTKFRDDHGGWHLSIEAFGEEPGFSLISDIDNGHPCRPDSETSFASIERVQEEDVTVRTDAQGRLWLLVGLRPTYMGQTAIYFESIEVELRPAP